MVISTISIAISRLASSTPNALSKWDPEPNLALWSTADPVTLFAVRGLVDAGSERVTKPFRFVASTFSNVRSFECEMLASGVDGISLVRSLSGGTWASAAGARTSLHPTPVNGRLTAQPNRHIDQPASPRTMRSGGEPAIPPGPVRALRASVRCGGGRVQSRGERPIERPGCGW
jgi:hypothetical protein